MTILDRIIHRASKAAELPTPRLRADPYWEPPSEIRMEKQIALYTKLSWIQIAIKHASQAAAATPYVVREQQGKDLRVVEGHDFLTLLERPNPRQSRFEFLEATFSWRSGAGNCYWWLNRPNAETPPAEIFIIPANKITPVPDGRMGVRGYLYDYGGATPMPLEAWEIVHFKTWNPLDPYIGLSPIDALRIDAMGDIGAQQFNGNFYSRDNAKGAGFLVFKDYIDDERWKRMREDWRDQHGGTQNRRVIQLRGVGDGGAQWIPAQLSQQEMGYLAQRTFTKEQIYDMFAPGLSSILSVNATEANSTAGKDTFLSMCVYPQHVAVSEKIDSDILPAYGENLDGEFEDVRRVDTAQELREQEEYSKSHTLDEIRARWYQDKPIGDERGSKLLAEIKAGGNAAPLPPTEGSIIAAGKALDLRRWRDKAAKAFVAGRALDVPFDPEYLTDDEAMGIRAALKRARTAEDVATIFRGE